MLIKALFADSNQEKIVEEGGLDALLMLLGSSDNTTIHRVASGAIANLAMSGTPSSTYICVSRNQCFSQKLKLSVN